MSLVFHSATPYFSGLRVSEIATLPINKGQNPQITQTTAAVSPACTQNVTICSQFYLHTQTYTHSTPRFPAFIQGCIPLHLDLKQPLGTPCLESFSSPNSLSYWSGVTFLKHTLVLEKPIHSNFLQSKDEPAKNST